MSGDADIDAAACAGTGGDTSVGGPCGCSRDAADLPALDCEVTSAGTAGVDISLSELPFYRFVFVTIVFYSLFILASLAICLYRSTPFLLLPPVSEGWPLDGLLLGVTVSVLSCFLLLFKSWRDLFDEIVSLLGRLGFRRSLVLAVGSGLGEEALFRGALLPWMGLGASSLLFGLIHFPINRKLRLWPLFATMVGAAFGELTIRTGTWLSAAIAHATVNFLNLVIICSRRPLREPDKSY